MKKKIVIVGGGIIGCVSAIYLNRYGHDVSIIEKSENLGGVLTDQKFNQDIFLKGTQYLDVNVEWFRVLKELVPDLNIFDYSYGSYTNLNSFNFNSEDFAIPVFNFDLEKENIQNNHYQYNSLADRINQYPEDIKSQLIKFFSNSEIDLNKISSACVGNLGISRVALIKNENLKKLKSENKIIDDLYAIKRNEIYNHNLQYALPKNGFTEFFLRLRKKLEKENIKVFTNSRIFPEWKNGNLEIALNNKKINNDCIFWSGNPTHLIQKFLDSKLDSFVFRTLQVNANIENLKIKERFIQVYSKSSKIFRINLYNLNNIPKIGVECFFHKEDSKNILNEALGILKKFKLELKYSETTINKNLINRFDIFTISDKQTIEQFLQKTKNSNLLFSPWTSYGRTEKIEKILDNFKKLNLIN